MICHAYFIGGSQDLTKMVLNDPPVLYYFATFDPFAVAEFGKKETPICSSTIRKQGYRLSHMDHRYPHSPYDIAIYIYDGDEN